MKKRKCIIDVNKYIVPGQTATQAYVAEDGTHVVEQVPVYDMPWSVYLKVVAQTLAERRRKQLAERRKNTRRKAA